MEDYAKIIKSSYEGLDLNSEVNLLRQREEGAWYEVRLSRLGETFIYPDFFLAWEVSPTEDEVVVELKDYLASEYRAFLNSPTYRAFCYNYGIKDSESLYEVIKRNGALIGQFFSPEEIERFEVE